MKKGLRRIAVCFCLSAACWSVFLLSDRKKLNEGLIRFHVVANSDSDEDQSNKQIVRDAVLESMRADLQNISDIAEAKEYLRKNLPKIQQIADRTLKELGFAGEVRVSLCRETFDVRHYDTFALPAGVYESLRIVIGEGQGKNWWCVSFPALCLPATVSGFRDAAVGAGFSDALVQTLSGNDGYEFRFYLLDQLGRLENFFCRE